jgi:DNA invertase Pin-like site-specific DNA recombinase
MGSEDNYVGRKVGYMRVSTDEQDFQMQRDALIRDGVPPDRIFFDKMSGKSQNRPGLRRAIKVCWKDDIIVVWKLDRLGRSLSGLIQTMEELEKAGIGFRSITEQFDTSAPGGRMLMQMMMVMAEFERSMIAERTKAVSPQGERLTPISRWGRSIASGIIQSGSSGLPNWICRMRSLK